MATNIENSTRARIRKELDLGGAASSGDIVLVGELMHVLVLEDTDANDLATCELPGSTVVNLSCVGADGSGNAAIAVGDGIYLDTVYNADDANGTLFGYALGAVSSGATTTIPVLLI